VAAPSATPHSGQVIIGSVARLTPPANIVTKPPSLRIPVQAASTNTATSDAGTVASLIGTRRPATPTIQRGNTSPQRWNSPSVSTEPTSANAASPNAAASMPSATIAS
jgi:hypothetical protein